MINLVKLHFANLGKKQFKTQFYELFKTLTSTENVFKVLNNDCITHLAQIFIGNDHSNLSLINSLVMKKVCKAHAKLTAEGGDKAALKEQLVYQLFFFLQDFYPAIVQNQKTKKVVIDGKADTEKDSTNASNFFTNEEVNDVLNLALWILE